MNSKVGHIKVKALVKFDNTTLATTVSHWKSVRKYTASRWRLYFLGQRCQLCLWLAALVLVYSLATTERPHKMFWQSMNGRVSVVLLLAMVFPLGKNRGKNIKALCFASLFYSQLYRLILVALYFPFCRRHAILFTDTFQRC